jgi:NitT/TauT family transport system permease protein
MVAITDPGDVSYFSQGVQVERSVFLEENASLKASGGRPATGTRENPVYLPPPHEVAKALITAFRTEPIRSGEPWLHESLMHSVRIILSGFLLSALFGIPLGLLCGTFALYSRLTEPFVDFIRYMPAPAFGALSVAVLGIDDAPKVAIIFIGTFFQMVLVLANTTRSLPLPLLEAAQTLGAGRRQLLLNVVVPGIMPLLYRDMRILLGWAWTYLIVAELIGASSGISFFIYQQAKYRNYDNVYAAIIIIGLIGLGTDLVLKYLGRFLFPWDKGSR